MKTPLRLKDLTPEQYEVFKKHIYNGVGSRDFFIDPHDLIFKKAAEEHDFLYFVGGPDDLRKFADKLFLKEARKAVKRQRKYTRPLYYTVAYTYYSFLVIGGKYAWEYHPEPASTWKEFLEHVRLYFIRKNKSVPNWLLKEIYKV